MAFNNRKQLGSNFHDDRRSQEKSSKGGRPKKILKLHALDNLISRSGQVVQA